MKISDSQKAKIRNKIKNRRVTRPFKSPDFPDMIVLEYSKAIIKEVNKIDKLIKEILIPELDRITNTKNERLDSSIRLDIDFKKLSGVSLVDALIRKIKSIFYGETLSEDQEPRQSVFIRSIKRLSRPFLDKANKFSEDRFVKEFEKQTGTLPLKKHLDVKIFLDESLARNVNLIKTIPSKYFSDISTLVHNAVDQGQLSRDVKKELDNIKEKSKNNARLIARDQIAKLVADTNEVRQRNLGITEYIWRTMQDGRVRSFSNTKGASDHERLNGTIQKWSNPPITVFKGKRAGTRNHPGKDIQCFIPGTMINTENGQKPIENIKFGDVVHSHWGLQRVVETHKNNYEGKLIGVKLLHKTIWLTPGHKIHTANRGWVEARHLKTSDKVEKFQKFFTCNFFHKKTARNIEHPHPHLSSQKDMSIGVDCTHSGLNFYNCVKFIKFKIGLIIRSTFFVWFSKLPLRGILNTKNIEPSCTNNLWFWNHPVFPVSMSWSRHRWNSEFFSLRIFNPLGCYCFATVPYFNAIKIKGFFNTSSCQSDCFVDIPVRPKIIDIFVNKPLFKRNIKFFFNFIKSDKNLAFVRTILRTKFSSAILELMRLAFKFFTTCPTYYVHKISCIIRRNGFTEHLHDNIQEVLCQEYNGLVYNFGVDKSMSYFADGILVENCRCIASPVYDEITGISHPDTIKAREKTA